MEISIINPENMVKPRGYSHAVSVSGAHKTIYIGGQDAIDEAGRLVGPNDLMEQTRQALANIEKVLEKAGAKLGDVIKLGIHIKQGRNPLEGFQAFQAKWGDNPRFPAITVLFVAELGRPDWLVEIDAVAVVPE